MAAEAAGDVEKALTAFSRAYYEFPFSDLSPAADLALDRLPNRPPIAAGTNRFKLELGRAEQLFGGKRYTLARAAFAKLQGAAQGDDLELVNLRIAESDYFLKQLRAARDGVKPYIEKASRQGEALFFYAVALYDLGNRDEYFRVVRRIADDFPTQTWSEEALNHLATHFIVDDQDAKADETFREMYARFPGGRYAERAAWKIGWLAYRNQQYADTIRVFESAAARFPRSGLPSAVAVLVGAGPRRAEGNRRWRKRATRWPRPTISTAITAGWRSRVWTAPPPASADRQPAGGGRRTAVERRPTMPKGGRADCAAPAERAAGARAARPRPLRSGDQRAAVRAEGVGRLAGDSRRRSPGFTRSRARRRKARGSSRCTARRSTR